MKRVRSRGVQTSTVKQSAAARTSQWAARHSRQVVRVLRSGAGSRPRSLRTLARGAPRDLMTEVAEGTPNTGVVPLAVLGGHPDDEPADRVHAPWAARSATAAAVVWPRDQLSRPAEEGIGRDQGVQVTEYPSPEARGLCGHDEELQHFGNRRHTGRAEQRLSAVTNVATRRASSVESARRTASIGFLDSTGVRPSQRWTALSRWTCSATRCRSTVRCVSGAKVDG